ERDIIDGTHDAAAAPEHATARLEVLGQTIRFKYVHQAAPLCMATLASQQRAVRPLSRLNSGGASWWQRSNAAGQRAAKAQPRGKCDRSGGWPSIAVSRWRLSVIRGIELSSALV